MDTVQEGTSPAVGNRPIIDTTDAELHALADQAWAAIVAANDPPVVFRRGNKLVRVADGPDGRKVVEPFDKDALSLRLSRVARWRRTNPKGDVFVVHPPERVAKIILGAPPDEYPGVPNLDRVAHAPFFAAPPGKSVWDTDEFGDPEHDVRLVTVPGYHADIGVYYDPDPELDGLEVTGSNDDLAYAVSIINNMLGDFPYAGRGSAPHAVSLLLLPFVRDLINGDTPLYLITAPEAGTGKGLLTDALLKPSTKIIPRSVEANDEAEWRKRITSELLEAPSVIFFDNLKSEPGLNSSTMAAVLTSGGWWKDRKLGVSQVVTVPVRNVWVATGNNVAVSAENSRRIARIHLDRGVEDPASIDPSKFAIPNLSLWIDKHRKEVVWAALTIVQSWLNGHTSEGDVYTPWLTQGGKLKQSYIEWSRVMGGILTHIKMQGFLEQDDLLDTTERDELDVFFETWATTLPNPVTARELADACLAFGSELNAALPQELVGLNADKLRGQMGYWLRSKKNKVAGGKRLVPIDGRIQKYTIVSV